MLAHWRTFVETVFGALFFVARVGASPAGLTESLFPPTPSRLINVHFYVDNRLLLDQRFLEVSVVGKTMTKKFISIDALARGKLGAGRSNLAVPEGPVELAICGIVKCLGRDSAELVCGRAYLPGDISPTKEHEVTFSTHRACEDMGPTAALPSN